MLKFFLLILIPAFFLLMMPSPSKGVPLHNKVNDQNGTTTDDRWIIVFSLSFKVFHAESRRWYFNGKNEFRKALARICHFTKESTKFTNLSKKVNVQVIFAREWLKHGLNTNSSLNWPDFTRAEEYCESKFKVSNYLEQDVGTEAIYEPFNDLNSNLLESVHNKFNADGSINIIFATNFAEKALANHLNRNKKRLNNVQLVCMNALTFNYFYYALEERSKLFFYTYYCYYEEKKFCTNYFLAKYIAAFSPWPLIYIFALSKNLTEQERKAAVNAAKSPLDTFFVKNHQEIRALLMSPFINWKEPPERRSAFFNKLVDIDREFNEIFVNINLYSLDNAMIRSTSTFTSGLFTRALETFYTQFFGAQLPPEMARDAVRKPTHLRPRIVLITDFVEERFINSLPDKNNVEFKVYALNAEVYDAFQGKADAIIPLNRSNPGFIPVAWGDPEPNEAIQTNSKILPNYVSIKIFHLATIGGAILLFFGLIVVLILCQRMRHLNWLNKLERFKTEHLFTAYKDMEACKEANIFGQANYGQANFGQALEEDTAQDQWEMRWDQLLLNEEKLGKGVFGEVHKATLTSAPPWMSGKNGPKYLGKIRQGSQVAVKMLPEHASARARQDFLEEIERMKSLGNGHRCVLAILGCISRAEGGTGILGLVLEFCPGGSLLEHLRKLATQDAEDGPMEVYHRPFPRWAWQIADGMLFLASKNLCHRDLAARNVFLDGEMVAKISDFGLCINLDKCQSGQDHNIDNGIDDIQAQEEKPVVYEKLPIRWLAPECLERRLFSQKSDVWSFGILLHEMYTLGHNPFEAIGHRELLGHIRLFRLEKLEECPEKIFACLCQCLQLEPNLRPDFGQIQTKLRAFLEENTGEYGYLLM